MDGVHKESSVKDPKILLESEDSDQQDILVQGSVNEETQPNSGKQEYLTAMPRTVNTSLPKFFDKSVMNYSTLSGIIENESGSSSSDTRMREIPGIQIDAESGSESMETNSVRSGLMAKAHSRQTSVLSNGDSIAPSFISGASQDSDNRNAHYSIDARLQTRLSAISASSGLKVPNLREKPAVKQTSHAIDALSELGNLSSPWEAVRWSKLRRLSSQLYADQALSSYGRPTVIVPSSFIAIGTTKGVVLIFDYHQTLIHVLGQHNKVSELGQVTSLAVSFDQTYVGAGYEDGTIITWELARPGIFNIKISAVSRNYQETPNVEGHLEGSSILHLAFVGKRHSSLISGDSLGMVLIHDTFRTILGRMPKSRLVLGKFPSNIRRDTRKSTAILACALRPLASGPKSSTGDICLVAVMTPYYLVIISPLPNPQTQFKAARHSEANISMGFSACLSWYPAVKETVVDRTHTRLAYCWSNICKILEVTQVRNPITDEYRLLFHCKKKYISDEPIVDVEWITPKLLALVTITQRLLIINEESMTVSAVVDLINKHVMHYDTYSASLRGLQVSSAGGTREPVIVADNFEKCIKSFKGRLFLLGKYEFVVGTLSTWADRLMDIMESGDQVRAIELATSFYMGEEESVALGLPLDSAERHKIVSRTIPDLILVCLKAGLKHAKSDDAAVREMADTCFVAICSTGQFYLLDDIYESFEEAEVEGVFFDRLITFIYNGEISSLPPPVFKQMVLNMTKSSEVLEDVICRLDTSTLDLDLTLNLCKKYNLQDTEIYIWNMALNDFVNPLLDILKLVNVNVSQNIQTSEADKVYPYLSHVLTGRVYPTGLIIEDEDKAHAAKTAVYNLLFFGNTESWSGDTEFTQKNEKFPYISLLLKYSCPAFFTALNEAFEDSFLNDGENPVSISTEGTRPIGRQLIVTILIEIFASKEYEPNVRIFFDIFIARNYPKFSQFIILPGKQLAKITEDLTLISSPEIKEECEIALQSLFSKHRPANIDTVISVLYDRQYFSVLQYLYKTRQKYDKYLRVTFDLFSQSKSFGEVSRLFSVISDCFAKTSSPSQTKERSQIELLVTKHFKELAELDCERLVALIDKHSAKLHEGVVDIHDKPDLQLRYIKEQFRLATESDTGSVRLPNMKERNLYVSLLSKRQDSDELHKLLNSILIGPNDVDLPAVVDDLMENKCIDILVKLLCRQKRESEALIYLFDHLYYLDEEYSNKPDPQEKLASSLKYYVDIGISLCQSVERNADKDSAEYSSEKLWIRLLDTLVRISQEQATEDTASESTAKEEDTNKSDFKQQILRDTLAALLDSPGKNGFRHNHAVIRIFRSLLSPDTQNFRTIGSVRPILSDLFTAYKNQSVMLKVVNEILDSDSYQSLLELVAEKLKGWKVSKSGECEGCGEKVIGVGVNIDWIYGEWRDRQKVVLVKRLMTDIKDSQPDKGKSKRIDEQQQIADTKDQKSKDILVVFKCGHSYHLSCLQRLGTESETELHCIVCH